MSDDGEDAGDMWREHKKLRQEKRASNRDASAKILMEEGIAYDNKNMGAHLIVKHNGITVDFWPGTGKWKDRIGKQGRGVINLIKYLRTLT